MAGYALSELDEASVLVAHCEDEQPFYCNEGQGLGLSIPLSKYHYYLNKDSLPVRKLRPIVFSDDQTLTEIGQGAIAQSSSKIVILGSRGNLPAVLNSGAVLGPLGFDCAITEFYLAAAAVCIPSPN